MRKAVSVVFTYKDKIFSIKRQDYLSVFPGYLAFPGGKVDKADSSKKHSSSFLKNFEGDLMHALEREVKEELGIELTELPIMRVEKIAIAITPEFNPYRFETYFFWVELKEEFPFVCDKGEVKSSSWSTGKELFEQYTAGAALAVPPTVRILKRFAAGKFDGKTEELRLPYLPETEVPWIESISGVIQFLPLSNTFPPANRTNCFLIGDTLIDPSPKDEREYEKLVNSINKFSFKKILLTHHHPDHFQYSNILAKEKNVPILLSQDTFERITKIKGSEYFSEVTTVIVADGDKLTNWKETDVLLMAVPGHDEGQLAPFVSSGEWFLAGDLFQSIGTVVIGGAEGDMAKYFSSLKNVIQMNPAVIIPSHGIAMGGVYKLEKTLKHRIERESQILKLAQKGKTSKEILKEVYVGLEEKLFKYAFATIEKHLDKLKKEGRL